MNLNPKTKKEINFRCHHPVCHNSVYLAKKEHRSLAGFMHTKCLNCYVLPKSKRNALAITTCGVLARPRFSNTCSSVAIDTVAGRIIVHRYTRDPGVHALFR